MKFFIKLINNRNFILIAAFATALLIDDYGIYLKNYTLYILAVVMVFSTAGISFRIFKDYKSVLKVSFGSLLLNYIIHGAVLMTMAYLLFDDKAILAGFAVVAATPPGVAIVPFTFSFNGNTDYALKGIMGTYLLSIFISPLIIKLLAESENNIDPAVLINVIIKIVVIPLILSRLLTLKKTKEAALKIRPYVINWGFALIIYTAIALNKKVILSETDILLKASLIFSVVIFALGLFHKKIFSKILKRGDTVAQNLMLTIKSTGFAVAASIALFNERAAIPAAIMSVFVLLYLISASFIFHERKNKTDSD